MAAKNNQAFQSGTTAGHNRILQLHHLNHENKYFFPRRNVCISLYSVMTTFMFDLFKQAIIASFDKATTCNRQQSISVLKIALKWEYFAFVVLLYIPSVLKAIAHKAIMFLSYRNCAAQPPRKRGSQLFSYA